MFDNYVDYHTDQYLADSSFDAQEYECNSCDDVHHHSFDWMFSKTAYADTLTFADACVCSQECMDKWEEDKFDSIDEYEYESKIKEFNNAK